MLVGTCLHGHGAPVPRGDDAAAHQVRLGAHQDAALARQVAGVGQLPQRGARHLEALPVVHSVDEDEAVRVVLVSHGVQGVEAGGRVQGHLDQAQLGQHVVNIDCEQSEDK